MINRGFPDLSRSNIRETLSVVEPVISNSKNPLFMIKHLSSLFRRSASPRGLRKSSSTLWVSGALAAVVLFGSIDTSYGYRLTNRDMRYFGYSGIYRGFVQGEVGTRNGGGFDYRYVDQRSSERLPTGRREVVTGPTGNNGFFLNHSAPRGNGRRIKIRSFYSGVSRNDIYGENMVGSGSKVVTVVRRGYRRYDMSVVDKLNERAEFDGQLFSYWRIRGGLGK
jgi:hypothetical protein